MRKGETVRASVFALVGFLLGMIAISVSVMWTSVSEDFFKITLVQCLQLTVMVFLGAYVGYWVNVIFNRQARTVALCDGLLETVQLKLTEAVDLSLTHMRKPAKDGEIQVLTRLRVLSFHITILEKAAATHSRLPIVRTVSLLKQEYFDLKSTVTGGTFGSKERRYDSGLLQRVEGIGDKAAGFIIQARFELIENIA